MVFRLRFVTISITVLATLLFCLPSNGHAAPPPDDWQPIDSPHFDITTCASNPQNYQGLAILDHNFTTKIITCIKGTIQAAMHNLLVGISEFMLPITGAVFTLAVAVFGIRIMGGERQLMPKAIGFLIRMGLIVIFSYNLGNLDGWILAIFDELSVMGTPNGFSPWESIDEYLGIFLGFASGYSLVTGFIGLLTGALFSSTTGILLFLSGLLAIANVLFFVVRIIFTYLSAYLIVAFMIVISPFIIPLAMFFWTERYFTKWLHILFSAMLTPMLLFAFLAMFMGIFSHLIGEVFCVIGFRITALFNAGLNLPAACDGLPADAPLDFRAFFKLNQPLFSWLMPADPGADSDLRVMSNPNALGDPAIQSNIAPLFRRAQDTGTFNLPGISFGTHDVQITQTLIFAFVKLWVFATLMMSIVRKIPAIASDIAGVSTVVSMGPTSYETGTKNLLNETRNKFADGLAK
jgi:type IV secretory pathway VirB6-like protein